MQTLIDPSQHSNRYFDNKSYKHSRNQIAKIIISTLMLLQLTFFTLFAVPTLITFFKRAANYKALQNQAYQQLQKIHYPQK